jgi:hypothetical protein
VARDVHEFFEVDFDVSAIRGPHNFVLVDSVLAVFFSEKAVTSVRAARVQPHQQMPLVESRLKH